MNPERHDNCWVMPGAIFASFALSSLIACYCFLSYWWVVILTALQTTTFVYFLCLYVPLNIPIDFSGYFSWKGNGRSEHGVVVVEWISACVWCLVSACSSSWHVLYFWATSFELLSTFVWPRARSWRRAEWERNKQTNVYYVEKSIETIQVFTVLIV